MAGRLGRTLWTLFLACLNATLILVALCLWLAWQVTSTVEDVSANIATSMAEIEPLGGELREISGALTGIQGELGAVRSGEKLVDGEALGRIEARLAEIETRVDTATRQIGEAVADPEVLMERAIDRIAEEIKTALRERAGPAPTSAASE